MDAGGMTRLLGHIWMHNGTEPEDVLRLPSGKRAFALAAAQADLEEQQKNNHDLIRAIQKMFSGRG